MRDLTYPPIILAAKTGFRLLGQRIRVTGADHVPREGEGGAMAVFQCTARPTCHCPAIAAQAKSQATQ